MTAIATRTEETAPISEETVTSSCGNIYADLGLPYPDQRMAKSVLALTISDELKKRKMTQQAAAELFGTDRSKISDLRCGRLTHFTFDRLLRFCNALGLDTHITVTRSTLESGQTVANMDLRSPLCENEAAE
jgi:predicted XRE-type DNA-binding protein